MVAFFFPCFFSSLLFTSLSPLSKGVIIRESSSCHPYQHHVKEHFILSFLVCTGSSGQDQLSHIMGQAENKKES